MAKASDQLLAGLNEALSEELTTLFQYLWHHIQGKGTESATVSEIFKATSMTEMNHAYKLAERIDLLGRQPTMSMAPVKTGGDVTEQMLIGILKDEQEHANQWETILGQ
jgi:bacterioferritin